MKSRILWSLPFVCLLFAARPIHAAFTIEPALITFLADKGEKTTFVEIVHVSGGPAAIQLSVHDRLLDIDGALIKKGIPKSYDFVVHPAQVILYPKERATIQIQYKGKGKITADKAYVLYSEEVPIDVEQEDKGVNMLVRMVTNYYTVILLDAAKPGKLVFVSSKAIEDGKIEVVAENRGAGRVSKDKFQITVDGRPIKEFTGKSNSVMPGQTRRFIFEWPRPVSAKEVKFVY
jgi:P pilus assembly chaperone PapD